MSVRRLDLSRQGERLQIYLDGLTESAGHADRMIPMENYIKGLMLPIERKSVEPMAARLAPGNVRQMHQSLHHIIADAAWRMGSNQRVDGETIFDGSETILLGWEWTYSCSFLSGNQILNNIDRMLLWRLA